MNITTLETELIEKYKKSQSEYDRKRYLQNKHLMKYYIKNIAKTKRFVKNS